MERFFLLSRKLKVITKADEAVKQDEEDIIIDNRDWVYETKSFVILPGLINEKNSQNVQNEKLDDIIIVEVKKARSCHKRRNQKYNC